MKLANLKVINGSIINAIDSSAPGSFLTSAEITTMRRIFDIGKTRYLYTSIPLTFPFTILKMEKKFFILAAEKIIF